MRGDCHADDDNCHSGCCSKSPQAKPISRAFEAARFLANLPQHVPGKQWRNRRYGGVAENIPQFFVIFAFHSLRRIELLAQLEVALEWSAEKNDIYTPGASRKPSSCRIRVGCRILRKAFASI